MPSKLVNIFTTVLVGFSKSLLQNIYQFISTIEAVYILW